jgi:tetratricopeptide (TPR) repeat protein
MDELGKQSPVPAQTTASPAEGGDPRSDPNMIQVFDEVGRELFITKAEWRKNVLPGMLEAAWDAPEKLYGILVGSVEDGFTADLLDAAERLYQIDSNRARGACMYSIVLTKSHELDEAAEVLCSYIERYGEDGYVLTNLAKVYAERGDAEKAEATLWRALEIDPNQTNAVGWYGAIFRERQGETGWLEAMRRVAALPGSWNAQLWLARTALDAHDLPGALAYYEESLARAGDNVSMVLLMQMGGDLGNHGYLKELIELTEPRFMPKVHGLPVGNNLMKAHVDLGEIEAARRILEQLYVLKRPDYKATLDFWEREIAKARVQHAPVGDQ